MRKIPRLYWDASVFLSYINGDADRLPDIDALLEHAKKNEVEIITSTASITEVAFGAVELEGGSLEPEVEAKINQLWTPSSPIATVEMSVLVAEEARGIIRSAIVESHARPKPMDAIHICTAQRMKADVLHTYDEKMQSIAKRLGIVSEAPKPDSPRLPL